jgi:hypothetical protein
MQIGSRMTVQISEKLHHLADDLSEISISLVVEVECFYGEKFLQNERRRVGANEAELWLLARLGSFILSM